MKENKDYIIKEKRKINLIKLKYWNYLMKYSKGKLMLKCYKLNV